MPKKALKEYLAENTVTWVAPSGLEFKVRLMRNPLQFQKLVFKHGLQRKDWTTVETVPAEKLETDEGRAQLLENQSKVIEKVDVAFADIFRKMVISPKIITEGESDAEKDVLAFDDMSYTDRFGLFRMILSKYEETGQEMEQLFRQPTGPGVAGEKVEGGSSGNG
jgi:hypothetical protein